MRTGKPQSKWPRVALGLEHAIWTAKSPLCGVRPCPVRTWKSYAILLSVQSQQEDGQNSLETNLGPQIKLEGMKGVCHPSPLCEDLLSPFGVSPSPIPSNKCMPATTICDLKSVQSDHRNHWERTSTVAPVLQMMLLGHTPYFVDPSSGDGHFSCFHFLPSMSNAVLCIWEQSCVDTGFLLSSISLERQLLGYVVMHH